MKAGNLLTRDKSQHAGSSADRAMEAGLSKNQTHVQIPPLKDIIFGTVGIFLELMSSILKDIFYY